MEGFEPSTLSFADRGHYPSVTAMLNITISMALIINGKKIEIPGLTTKSWQDGPSWLKEITDFNPRTRWLRMIVMHTHKGVKGKVLPGIGKNSSTAENLARYQTNTDRQVSWDFTIDRDGSVLVQNDPAKKYSWQAGNVNSISLGFELVQTDEGDVYEGQIEKTVLLIDALTALLGIQRQIAWSKKSNGPKVSVVKRLQDGGSDVVGVVGHRNQTTDRGPGDPGDAMYLALQKAGYECFDLDEQEDLKAWKDRQKALGFPMAECDGVPGPKTIEALKAKGHKFGLWVKRPVDDLLNP